MDTRSKCRSGRGKSRSLRLFLRTVIQVCAKLIPWKISEFGCINIKSHGVVFEILYAEKATVNGTD